MGISLEVWDRDAEHLLVQREWKQVCRIGSMQGDTGHKQVTERKGSNCVDVRDVSLKVVHFVCACVCPCYIQVSGYHSWSHITDVSFVVVCCLNGCSCVSHPVHTWADGRFQFRWGNKIAGLVFKSRAVLWRFATKLWSYTHFKSFLSNVARFVFLWFLFNLSRCDI